MTDILQITSPLADLMSKPQRSAMRVTQALLGEPVEILSSHEGWAHIRLMEDGYEGFVEENHLGLSAQANKKISVPATHAYPLPDIKSSPASPLYWGSQLHVIARDGDFYKTNQLEFIRVDHIDRPAPNDAASHASLYLNVPYLWGGKSFAGIDCSGLIQLSLLAIGVKSARDSGPQSESLGVIIPESAQLSRNDLIFWPGHVGILSAPDKLIHANAFHMMVVEENLDHAIHRIGQPSIMRRLNSPAHG